MSRTNNALAREMQVVLTTFTDHFSPTPARTSINQQPQFTAEVMAPDV
jgi:hypothetical protein